MYKISMYDNNMPAFVTGCVEYFTESLEDFEEHWKPLVGEGNVKTYENSKAGYYDNEFMGGGSSHDMVIGDLSGRFLEKKTLTKTDFAFTIRNGWGCTCEIFAKKLVVTMGLLEFQREKYVVAKYRMEGVCRETLFGDLKYEYKALSSIWGNPVLTLDVKSEVSEYRRKKSDNGCWDSSAPKETFEEDTLESFVWLIVGKRKSIYEVPVEEREEWENSWHKITKKQLVALFRDILGEAG